MNEKAVAALARIEAIRTEVIGMQMRDEYKLRFCDGDRAYSEGAYFYLAKQLEKIAEELEAEK